jgi:hypothetical protein
VAAPTDYKSLTLKFFNGGLNLALPPDLIGEHRYTRLTNVRTLQDGQLASRYGLAKTDWGTNCGWIVFMSRLAAGAVLFVLSDGKVFVNNNQVLVYDDALGVGTRTGTALDPNPEFGTLARRPLVLTDVEQISLVKFTNSFSGEDWAFLATQEGMWKIDTQGRAYKWGIRPPKKVLATNQPDNTITYEYTPAPLTPALQPCPPDAEGDFGCGLDDVSNNTNPYRWVYTYYNSRTGSESNPCDEMAVEVVNIQPSVNNSGGQSVKLTGFTKPTDPQVDRLRVYRYGGGLNEYILEQEVPWDTTEFISYRPDFEIASNPILSFENDVPFTTKIPKEDAEDVPTNYVQEPSEFGITGPVSLFETPMGRSWGPFSGSYLFALGDPYRPSVVYWTNYGNPDGCSSLNEVQVTSTSEPLQNGFVFGGNSFVWTKDNLYSLDWGGPTAVPTFVPREVPMGMGLSSPEAFAVGTQGVYFLSKDGIYVTDCSSFAESITNDSLKPIFLGQTVGVGDADAGDTPYLYPLNWDPEWLSETYMTVAAQELHFVYWDTQFQRVHLVYDILHKRWQKFRPANDKYTSFVYADINSSKYRVYVALNDGFVYIIDDTLEEGDQVSLIDYVLEVPFTCEVRTGAGDMGMPLTHKEFGVVMLDIAPFEKQITVKPLYDNETQTGTSFIFGNGFQSERQTLTFSLEDHYAKNISLDFVWLGKAILFQAIPLVRMDEEEILHWEHPETSMGISGWKHIRDLYLGLRSTDNSVLTVRVDGVDYSYVIPGTAGERRKVYVPLEPVKGKMFRFFLNAWLAEFEDPEVLKSFNPSENPTNGTPFRLYSDDTYLFVKGWHTKNTYQKYNLGGTTSG